jgi:DNA modification methylase
MEITNRALETLEPYARNSRTHSPEQVAQLVASIREYGWTNPVLIDERGGVIAGHGRIIAARQLGMAEVPCIVLAGLTEAQKKAYIIADNKLALNAGWDEELLRLELEDLKGLDFDLGLTGFSAAEIDLIFPAPEKSGLTDPDEVPDVPAEPVSKPGDVWILGRHRVMCGDSTNAHDVGMLFAGGGMPRLMVTDPPYGVQYDAKWRNNAGISSGGAHGVVLNDDIADWSAAWALFPGDVAYVWHAGSKSHIVAESLLRNGFEIRTQIIWAKNQLVIGRGDYHPQHEPCWYAVRKGKAGRFVGGRKQKTIWRFVADMVRPDEKVFVCPDGNTLLAISGDESTVWEIPKPLKSETGHSTQKPVECMARPIRNNSQRGDDVYEPFCGSGTTVIAAEQTGRNCYAMELNPPYVDVTVRRWQNFTGQKAFLESTCQPFPN